MRICGEYVDTDEGMIVTIRRVDGEGRRVQMCAGERCVLVSVADVQRYIQRGSLVFAESVEYAP